MNDSLILSEIKMVVAAKADITVDKMNERTRKREIVDARNICYAIARKITRLPVKKIGMSFNRDHSTVLNGLETHDDLMGMVGNEHYKYIYNSSLADVTRRITMIEQEPVINPS